VFLVGILWNDTLDGSHEMVLWRESPGEGVPRTGFPCWGPLDVSSRGGPQQEMPERVRVGSPMVGPT
jgi:hypothetical protein